MVEKSATAGGRAESNIRKAYLNTASIERQLVALGGHGKVAALLEVLMHRLRCNVLSKSLVTADRLTTDQLAVRGRQTEQGGLACVRFCSAGRTGHDGQPIGCRGKSSADCSA